MSDKKLANQFQVQGPGEVQSPGRVVLSFFHPRGSFLVQTKSHALQPVKNVKDIQAFVSQARHVMEAIENNLKKNILMDEDGHTLKQIDTYLSHANAFLQTMDQHDPGYLLLRTQLDSVQKEQDELKQRISPSPGAVVPSK